MAKPSVGQRAYDNAETNYKHGYDQWYRIRHNLAGRSTWSAAAEVLH